MPELIHRSIIDETPENLFAWHEKPGAFERLIPPWLNILLVERGRIEPGSRWKFELKYGPFTALWIATVRETERGRFFVDELIAGPFASWRHRHEYLPGPGKTTAMQDAVQYELPLGLFGRMAGNVFAQDRIARVFRFRHERTRNDVLRHKTLSTGRRFTVAITGASGLVGKALADFLTSGGHIVRRYTRNVSHPEADEYNWDPGREQIDVRGLAGADAVVHLAGENVGDSRWTPEKKNRILESRVSGTRLIAKTLSKMKSPPRALIGMSAVGFYGDRGDEILTEDSAPGTGFLSDVCRAWESETRTAGDAGIRVANLRSGLVLTAQGGALAKMLRPFKAGTGGRIGDGRQYMSWIDLDDLLAAILFIIRNESLSGPLNAVAPGVVTNSELTGTLGRALHRPALLPLPASAVKKFFGEMGESLLLSSQRVLPKRLTEAGFEFLFPNLENSLRFEIGLG